MAEFDYRAMAMELQAYIGQAAEKIRRLEMAGHSQFQDEYEQNREISMWYDILHEHRTTRNHFLETAVQRGQMTAEECEEILRKDREAQREQG